MQRWRRPRRRKQAASAVTRSARKKVGPSFREVAKKYPKQGDKILAALKADKDHADAIKDVKSDDLKLIADWIGSL